MTDKIVLPPESARLTVPPWRGYLQLIASDARHASQAAQLLAEWPCFYIGENDEYAMSLESFAIDNGLTVREAAEGFCEMELDGSIEWDDRTQRGIAKLPGLSLGN